MDFSYSELFKTIPHNQQQHFSHNVQPEVAAGYLYALQNQMKKKKKRSQPSTAVEDSSSPLNDISLNPSAIPAEMAVKKRRKGSDPRKCYNDTCDRIVTKRNYCYKCQKRKERGLALNPKLPSIKQLLLPSDKKRSRKATVPSSSDSLPNVNDINNSINTPSQSGSSFLPFNIVPNIKEPSDKLPNYFETVLVNLMKEKNASLPLNTPSASSAESQSYNNPNSMPNNTMFNSNAFSAADKQQLQNLHQYLLQLSNGSEEKASTLLSHYISARNSQTPSTASYTSTLSFDQTSHSSSFSPFPINYANGFSHNDPFNLFSPSNNSSSFVPSDRGSGIKFGPNDMFLLPSPQQVRPNLFATPDHNTPFNPSFVNASNNINPGNRMRFF